MLFHGSSISSLAILCAVLALVSQGQVAVALPLAADPTAAAVAVVAPQQHTNHDTRPWYIRRRFRSPEIQPCDNTHDDCDKVPAVPLLYPAASSTVTPRKTKNIVRQLLKRAPAFSESVLTGLFVALIVGSVLLGVGIASIAVCGFDWKNYLRKSDRREGPEDEVKLPPTAN